MLRNTAVKTVGMCPSVLTTGVMVFRRRHMKRAEVTAKAKAMVMDSPVRKGDNTIMAQANVTYKTHVQPIESVTLTLSEDEAIALFRLCAAVGGHPKTTHRKHIQSIHDALLKAQIPYDSNITFEIVGNSLYFKS